MTAVRGASRSRLSVRIAVSALASLVACGGGEQPNAPVQSVTTPTIAVSVPSSTLALVQGQITSTVVTIARTGSMNSAVDLSVDAVPSGVTATFSSASIPAGTTTSSLSIKAALDLAPQTFTITIRAHATGVADATAVLSAAVAAAPKNLALHFCPESSPIWAAAQAEGGKWFQIKTDGDGVFRLAIGAGGGIAVVSRLKDLEVVYGNVDDLASMFAACSFETVFKTISGNVVGLDNGTARVSLGTAISGIFNVDQFVLHNVESGPKDLIGGRLDDLRSVAVSSLIIRRSLNVADGTRLPTIDFHSAEAFATAKSTLTVQNFQTPPELALQFSTANGSQHELYYEPRGSARQTYVGVPSSRLAAGDRQLLTAVEDVSSSPPLIERFVSAWITEAVDQTLTFGPPLAEPVVSAISGSAYPRWHAVLPVQAEYSSVVAVQFADQNFRSASIIATGAYIPRVAGGWDLAIPDFASTGFDTGFGLQPSVAPSVFIYAFGGTTSLSNPPSGTTIRGSFRGALPFSRERFAATGRRPPMSATLLKRIRGLR